MPDIFLSYTREDQAAARRFADAFQKEGFSVWWDATLRSGEAYDQVTEKALREARAVVVLWSKRSAESRWVRAEATLADRHGTLVPAMIEPCERPIMFELTQTADLTHWQGAAQDEAWLAFVADVRRFVETLSGPRPAAPIQPPPKRAIAAASKPAILVLPFINMSADPEQDYFSDGVSEDIITDLGRVAALSVVSRTTAFGYKGRTVGVVELALVLGVSHIVEGSVRKAGQRVRITVQLLDAATDAPLWSERFDRTLEDIFAIQSEISEAIVAALKVTLAPAEKRAIEQRATSSSEAYTLYLMARQFSRLNTERLQPIVLRLSRRAVELDPDFAAAWALMSSAQCEMHQRGHSPEDGRTAAERAVALKPDLAEAHAARSDVLMRSGDFAAGLAAALEALKLDPDCFESHMSAGFSYAVARDHVRSIQHFELASALEPNACRPISMVVSQYEALGNRENTMAAGRRAIALAERVLAIEPDHGVALSAKLAGLTVLRDVERAREWARLARLLCPDNLRLHYNCACGLALLGDVEEVVAIMDGLIAEASLGYLRWMQTDSDFDSIRGDQRFVALMQRVSDRIASG